MESIKGRNSLFIDAALLRARLFGYAHCLIDLGTGDGRFVQHIARQNPGTFALGVDACRENLHKASAKALCNTLYLIANAQQLPCELAGMATHLTINFPWGTLLDGLLEESGELYTGIRHLGTVGTRLDIRLNGGALAESGWSLEEGTAQVNARLRRHGFATKPPVILGACELREIPTSWAKRLAFGRDPRATLLSGTQCS